MTSQLHHIAC